jgi:hypothetical protein
MGRERDQYRHHAAEPARWSRRARPRGEVRGPWRTRYPDDLKEAATVSATGYVERIDLAEVLRGLLHRRERLRATLGNGALAIAAVREAFGLPVVQIDVEIDGQRIRGRVPLLFLGNNRYSVA